jgi:hypothetical protein
MSRSSSSRRSRKEDSEVSPNKRSKTSDSRKEDSRTSPEKKPKTSESRDRGTSRRSSSAKSKPIIDFSDSEEEVLAKKNSK